MSRTGKRVIQGVAAVLLAIGVTVVAGQGPAVGADTEVENLRARIAATESDVVLRAALADLAAIDSAASRRALAEVAAGKSRLAAVLAVHTLARTGSADAATALRGLAADRTRDRSVRTAAAQGLLRLTRSSGAAAAEAELDRAVGDDPQVRAAALAAKAVYFPAAPAASRATEGR